MEIIKIIKVQMQVVKFTIYIFFLFGTSFIGNAQNILGTYRQIKPSLFAKDIGIEYIFKESGEFIKTKYEHLGIQNINEGTFSVSDDTLTLYYKDLDIETSTAIVHKEKLNSNTILETTIKTLNSNGNPQKAVNLVLQTQLKTPIMAFMSNGEGKFPKINLYDSYVKFLQISYIGKNDIYISTDSLFGYRTKINVRLKNSEIDINNKRRIEKFLIKENSSKRLELKFLENNSSFLILSKIK